MAGRTDFITEAAWPDVWLIWYVLVDDAYQTLEQYYGDWRQRGPQPEFSDSEVITVALIIDTWWHGHEALGLAFLRRYHADLFPKLPPDGWFNSRRTRLGLVIDQVRQVLTHHQGLIASDDPARLIDSAPLPVCTYARAHVCRTVDGQEYYGVQSGGAAKLFGFRLHVLATTDQVVDRWMLAPAAQHDSQVMTALLSDVEGKLVLGDNAYRNPTAVSIVAKRANTVLAPPRSNSTTPWPSAARQLVNRIRRRIESVFSVLTTVFDIEHPHARSLAGLVCRVSTRLLAYNLCFLTGSFLEQLARAETPN